MLVLARKRREAIVFDLREFGLGIARIVMCEVRGASPSHLPDRARLGIECDRRISVHREEVFLEIEAARAKGGAA